MSYRGIKWANGRLNVNTSFEGESIESKVRRITVNKEPIKDGAPIMYTDRKDGVIPSTDVRTDRFEIAIDAMDKVSGAQRAKRGNLTVVKEDKGGESGGQSIEARKFY
jgi:hypothetical protein